jgi:MFS family permease
VAIGLSIAGWIPFAAVVSQWFVKKRGFLFGILSAGFGLSLVSASFAQFLISAFGWQIAYVCLGLISMVIIAPLCLLLIRRSPNGSQLLTENDTQPKGESATVLRTAEQWLGTTWTLSRALKTNRFWLLTLLSILLFGIVEQIIIAHQIFFYRDAGYNPMLAANIYSVWGIAYIIGTFCCSFSDRFGREVVFIPACLTSAAATSLLFFLHNTSSILIPFCFAFFFGVGFGTLAPLVWVVAADLFQGRHYGSISGTISLGFALGGAVSPWFAGFVYDKTNSYSLIFIILIICLVISTMLMFLVAPRKIRPISQQARSGVKAE